MLNKILPSELIQLIESHYNKEQIREIRLRRNMPIVIIAGGECVELKNYSDGKIIYADKGLLDYVILRATESSLYCYNNQLKNCYISTVGGIRLGISGEAVCDDNGNVKTIKNINSIVLRVPHQVLNCSKPIQKYFFNGDSLNSILVISPPCAGKTTLIRDMVRVISSKPQIINSLVVDERFEIGATVNGENMLDLGLFTDCISGCKKEFAFHEGVRALNPRLIVTDELMDESDVKACLFAVNSGVKVIATIHGENILDVKRKPFAEEIFRNKIFDYYVVLSSRLKAGTIEGVFDNNFKPVW